MGQGERALTHVGMHRGLPSSKQDVQGYAAAQRQIAAWRALDRVEVRVRPLRYPFPYPEKKPEEKGIDVQLAVDFVMMAVRGEYDIGVVMSGDTDLRPAIEEVARLPDVRAEVAAWKPDTGYGQRISIKGMRLWCHWLDRIAYEGIRDHRDYNIP